MNLFKRFSVFAVVVVMFIMTGITVYAEESDMSFSDISCYNLEISSEGVVSCTDENGNILPVIEPRSSISGYGNEYLTSSITAIVIYPEASGIGGMGITINTSSNWNGYMSLIAEAQYGTSSHNRIIDNYAIPSNGEIYFNDILHFGPTLLVFAFDGIPQGQTVYTQIWVYG